MKKLFVALFLALSMIASCCFAETTDTETTFLKDPKDSKDFTSYGNPSALLISYGNSAELMEVDFFFNGFNHYKFEEKIDVLHFGNLYFTYTDSQDNGWLWLFNGNKNPIPFEESDYKDVFYWKCGIIVLTEDGFHEVDLSTTFNTSVLVISEDLLDLRMVDILLENQ